MLGVEPGASADEIKAAWRALARRHHPDLTGDDPDSARRATRRMAEINAAYAALTRAGETTRPARSAAHVADRRLGATRRRIRRRGYPRQPAGRPAPAPGRVRSPRATGPQRHRPAAQPDDHAARRAPAAHRPAAAAPDRSVAGAPRIAAVGARWSGTGSPRPRPRRSRRRSKRRWSSKSPSASSTATRWARSRRFEPSYIDWLATTMTRDPDVAMAARVIAGELDRRGIRRAHRPPRPGWQSNPYR